MAMFGFGQQDPYAEAEQAAQDRQTAFAGMKDNLPALGLIMGLSMLARNNGTRNVGQLMGQAGGDALNAYSTFQKMEEARKRQKQLDEERAEEREYARTQDAFRNDMAERQFGLEQAKMAQDMQLAQQRLGMEGARLALARQAAARELMTAEEKRKYDETHKTINGIVYERGADGKWGISQTENVFDDNGNIIASIQQPKASDTNALANRWGDASADYLGMGKSTAQIVASAKRGTAAGDISLLYAYMKSVDPRSTVREGEFATAGNAGGIPEKIRVMYNKAVDGQMLTPAQRADFVQQAVAGLKTESRAQAERNKTYRATAERYGINPADIIQDPYNWVIGDAEEWLKGNGAVSAARPAPTGKHIPGVTRGGPGGNAAPGAGGMSNDELLNGLGLGR